MTTFHEEVVFAPSEDQRWMAGVLMQPNEDSRQKIGVVCIHGATAAFYVPTFVYLGRALAEQGYTFLSGNTRTHDIASINCPWPLNARPEAEAGTLLGGTGWFRLEETAYDLAGWIRYMVGLGIERIVLFGHSMGVELVTYYQAVRQDLRIVGLILASGGDTVTPQDSTRVQLAEELVAQGKGYTTMPLLESLPPFLAMQSADSVVQWERLASPFAAEGHTPWFASIHIPILATVGTMEFMSDLRESLEGTRARAVLAPRFDIQVIDGADHIYTGQERALSQVTLDWLAQLPEAQ